MISPYAARDEPPRGVEPAHIFLNNPLIVLFAGPRVHHAENLFGCADVVVDGDQIGNDLAVWGVGRPAAAGPQQHGRRRENDAQRPGPAAETAAGGHRASPSVPGRRGRIHG